MATKTIKCVLVGDEEVGKTSFRLTCTTGAYHPQCHTAFIDSYSVMVNIDNQQYILDLFDTASQDDDDRLRPLSYPLTDVFIVCFSTVEPASFVHVRVKWIAEIHHYSPKTPFLLVGTQIDLRDDPQTMAKLEKRGEKPITSREGQQAAKELKAVKYLECSSRFQKGLQNILNEAVLAAIKSDKSSHYSRKCEIL